MRDKLIKLLLASDIKDKYDAADKADEILDLFNVSDSFISVSEKEYTKFLDNKLKGLMDKIKNDPKLLNVFKRLKDK